MKKILLAICIISSFGLNEQPVLVDSVGIILRGVVSELKFYKAKDSAQTVEIANLKKLVDTVAITTIVKAQLKALPVIVDSFKVNPLQATITTVTNANGSITGTLI